MVIPATNGRTNWGIQRHQGELLLAWLIFFACARECQGMHLDVLDQWLLHTFAYFCHFLQVHAILFSRPPLQRLHGIVPYRNCPLPQTCDLRKSSLYDFWYALMCEWCPEWYNLIRSSQALNVGLDLWTTYFMATQYLFSKMRHAPFHLFQTLRTSEEFSHAAFAHLYSFVIISADLPPCALKNFLAQDFPKAQHSQLTVFVFILSLPCTATEFFHTPDWSFNLFVMSDEGTGCWNNRNVL